MSNNRFELESKAVSNTNAKLLYVSISKYGGDWHSTMHTHDCTELFYVVHGQGQFRLEEESFAIQPDDMVIVNPHVEHTEVGVNSNPLEYIVVGVTGIDFFSEAHKDRRYSAFNCRDTREEVLFYLRTLLKEMETKADGYETVCQNLLDVLVLKLMRHSNFSVSASAAQRSSKECAMVKRYIDNNYTDNISLDFLADMAHMNKYYLVHVFNRENGISPINYLIRRRISESKFLLKNTNHSLFQIAGLLGFSSQSYFSQSFKKQENMSPNEYRRRTKLETREVPEEAPGGGL